MGVAERFSWLLRRAGTFPDAPTGDSNRAPSGEQPSATAAALEAAISEYRLRRWDVAEPLLRWVVEENVCSAEDRMVARNILGSLFERTDRQDLAIAAYEANLATEFEGSYPYERLAHLYRRRGDGTNELRVLRTAVALLERVHSPIAPDKQAQLTRFQATLREAEQRLEPKG